METTAASQKKPMKRDKSADAEERRWHLKVERLRREGAIGADNSERLRRAWMKTMMNDKIPRMQEDIEVNRNSFDRALDIKDHRMESLVESLDEAEVQYKRNLGSHVSIIDRLEKIYEGRLGEALGEYKRKLEEIIRENDADVQRTLALDRESRGYLASIIMRQESTCRDIIESTQSETAYKINNLRDDGNHAIKMALLDIENKIKFHWYHVTSIITNYSDATEHRRQSYDILKAKDSKARAVISAQSSEASDLSESIHKYEEKIKKLENTSQATAHSINTEKIKSWESYTAMKERFHNEETIDKAQVTHLTKEFNKSVKSLGRLMRKAQTVISCIRVCRKLEDKVEKPLGHRRVSGEPGFGHLQYFWHRLATTQIEAMALRQERKLLQEENASLKSRLKSKITGEDQ